MHLASHYLPGPRTGQLWTGVFFVCFTHIRTVSILAVNKCSFIFLYFYRFRTEDATIKTVLHQAAIGNDRDGENGARAQNRKSREDMLKTLVGNYHNMSNKAYMDSIVTFFDD